MGTSGGTPASRASSVRDVAVDVASNVHAALGVHDACVRVVLPDWAGRLRVLATAGPPDGRSRSSPRRRVFETGRDITVPLGSDTGDTLAILPLTAGPETLGVLELVAPATLVRAQRAAIVALVRQSAALIAMTKAQARHRETEGALEALSELTGELTGALSPIEAARVTAAVCSGHIQGPVAIARSAQPDPGWYLAASAGLSPRKRAELQAALRSTAAVPEGVGARPTLAGAFTTSTGRTAEVFEAEPAAVLAVRRQRHAAFLRLAASMLGTWLKLFTVASERLTDPDPRVDIGMVWAAHELRAPLAATRAALEHVISSDRGPDELELLRRAKIELEEMSSFVEPVLRWSAGASELNMKPVDLVEIAHQAVSSLRFDTPARQIDFNRARPVTVEADDVLIRRAISNLIQNAVAYSPESEPVRVSVEETGSSARVTVEDRGPGVPAGERDAVFTPSVRGAAAAGRAGAGLGLFLARRIAEAHGGVVRLEPSPSGSRFCLDLPVNGEPLTAYAFG